MRTLALLGLVAMLIGGGLSMPASTFAISGSWSTLALDARMDAAMVYDNYGDQFLFFGGTDGYQKFNDAWRMWPGYYINAWQKMLFSPSVQLPAARDGHTLIWDPVQRRVILFGGKDANGNRLNDVWSLPLWTWDGQAWQPYYGNWQQLTTTGASVPSLTQHTAVLDSQRGRMLVYGGEKQDLTLSDQLYALDLQTLVWSVVTIGSPGTGPHGRQGQVSIYDVAHDALLVYDGQEYLNGTYSWASPTVWRLRLSLPTPAWESFVSQVGYSGVNGGAVYKPDSHEMVIYGGNIPGNSASNFPYRIQLDIQGSFQLVQPITRIRRESLAYAYDPLRNQLQIFGGTEGVLNSQGKTMPRNDTWDLTLGASPDWVPDWVPTYERPYGGSWVSDASLVYDDQHQRTIMFGGTSILNLQETQVNRLFVLGLSGTVNQWGIPNWSGTLPSVRQDHSAIYDRVGDCMVLYGGINNTGDLSDLFALNRLGGQDLSSNDYQWVQLPNVGGPGSRSGHSAVYAEISPTNRKMIIFGGRSQGNLKGDTWSYDLVNHTWLNLNPGGQTPSNRADHGAVYDYINKRMYIFGGLDATGALNDVYYLDLTTNTWTKGTHITGPKPLARFNMSVVLSPYADGQMIVFGGQNGQGGPALADTWSIKVSDIPNGTSWSQITTTGIVPGERYGHVAVYQGGGHVLVAAGRLSASGPLDERYNDTWILQYDAGSFASIKAKPSGNTADGLAAPSNHVALNVLSNSPSGVTLRMAVAGNSGPFDLAIYDVAGRLRRHLDVSPLLKENSLTWDFRDDQGTRVPAGIYFIKLKGHNASATQRIVALH